MPTDDLPGDKIRSYILRLWVEGEPAVRVWRASLTRIPDGERLGFADLETAFRFLQEQMNEEAGEW